MKTHRKTLWLWRSLVLAGCSLPAGACVDAIVGDVGICEVDDKSYALNEKFQASDGCNTCICKIDGDVECSELSCSADAAVICDEKYGCSDAGAGPVCDPKFGCSLDSGAYPPPGMNPFCENVLICPDAGPGKAPIACYYICADAGRPTSVCDPKFGCSDAGAGWATCEYLGKTYGPGDTFRAADDCSLCSCGYNGVECRDMVCYEPDGSVAPGTCDYAGTLYKPGEWFLASDNCNKCMCTDTGVVECTRTYCNGDAGIGSVDSGVFDPGSKGSCNYMGKAYRVGEGFGKADNCNKCACVADGLIECSNLSCAPTGCTLGNDKLLSFGQSAVCEDGCNTCTCDPKGSILRTERACPALPPIVKCDAAMIPLAFPAPLVYVTGDAVAVTESRCVNGQSNDFSLCFAEPLNAMTYEVSIFVVPGSATRACSGTERVYSLVPLRQALQAATGQMSGKLGLRGNGAVVGYSYVF